MPATTKKAPESSELTEGHLNTLKRKDLLNLCKERGIKCVGKNSELIEKILELRPKSPAAPAFNSYVPMTPQKKLDMCLPIVNTPGSSAVIKSIVQSARKTGLNSSPIRIPFAMSPMAARFQAAHVSQIQFSPSKSMTAKDPSLPIKEAFLNCEPSEQCVDYIQNFENEEESDCLPCSNKRAHGEDAENADEPESKKEKLDESEETTEANKTTESEQTDDLTVDSSSNPLYSNSDDSLFSNPSAPNHPTFPHSLSSFSTDLLTDLRDPELASPELCSDLGTSVSRSEYQDQRGSGGTFTANPQTFSKSSSHSSSTSSSNAHPLLPSGIIKLLEKRRQEKEQHQAVDQTSHSATSTSTTVKKKFDLKESLKRSLPYKPHIGAMKNPKKESDL